MKVIINADDFGYSTTINNEICNLMRARRLTSTTIMANGPAFQEAVRQAAHFPKCSFGTHLNLTEFTSISQAQVLYDSRVVDEQGIFTGHICKIRPALPIARAVEQEWNMQIEKILDHGISISHLDSHHHVHTIPWLFVALKAVQRRFKIKKVRITMNWYYQPEYSPGRSTLIAKKAWNYMLKRMHVTKTTDHFTSFQWFIANMTSGEKRFGGTTELMCHPGHLWAANETALLKSNWADHLPQEVDKISFNDL